VISAAELASMQSTVATSFGSTVAIQRNVGGTWTTVATVSGTFAHAPILPQENPSQTQRLYIDDRWRFLLPAGTDVRFGDRLITGGRTFEVIQIPIPALEFARMVVTQELNA
jgi:hypothetical protein